MKADVSDMASDPTATHADAMAEVERLTRERDEARSDAAKLRKVLRGLARVAMRNNHPRAVGLSLTRIDVADLVGYVDREILSRADEFGIDK